MTVCSVRSLISPSLKVLLAISVVGIVGTIVYVISIWVVGNILLGLETDVDGGLAIFAEVLMMTQGRRLQIREENRLITGVLGVGMPFVS